MEIMLNYKKIAPLKLNMKNIIVSAFIIMPVALNIFAGSLSISGILVASLFLGPIAFFGVYFLYVLLRMFRASAWLFCWVPFLIWYTFWGWLEWALSGKFGNPILKCFPNDIAMVCAVGYYMLSKSIGAKEENPKT